MLLLNSDNFVFATSVSLRKYRGDFTIEDFEFFPGHFIIKILFSQLLVMSQEFCLFQKSLLEPLLGHDFLKVQCPKKQKFLFFEMLPAWNKMKLLIKLFEHNWEVIHLPSLKKKKHPHKNMRRYYSFIYTKRQHLIRKSTLSNDLVKPWKAH